MSVILGYGGVIELSREWPEPTVFPFSSLKATSNGNYILCKNPAFWTGQKVLIYCDRGLPFVQGDEFYAPCPDGYRFWGSANPREATGPATGHREGGSVEFWRDTASGDSEPFWEDALTVGMTQMMAAYVNRDPLDRLSFYYSEIGAINRNPSDAIEFRQINFGNLLIAPFANNDEYIDAIEEIGHGSFVQNPATEMPASQLTDIPSIVNDLSSDPSARGWYALAACREWTLQTEPTMLDTTAIGDEFGDSVKDVIRGAGSFNAFVPTNQAHGQLIDARGLIRLMMMTQTGARARARFRLQDQGGNSCIDNRECLWMECDILLGSGEISMSADSAVPYSAQFVVVKDKDNQGIKPVIGYFDGNDIPVMSSIPLGFAG